MQCRCLAHDCYFDDVRTAGAAAPPRDLRLCIASLRRRTGEGSLPAAATTPSQSENRARPVGISWWRDESAGKSLIGLRRHNRHIARPNCLPARRRKCRRIFGRTRSEASSVRDSVTSEANSYRRGAGYPISRLLCEKRGDAPGLPTIHLLFTPTCSPGFVQSGFRVSFGGSFLAGGGGVFALAAGAGCCAGFAAGGAAVLVSGFGAGFGGGVTGLAGCGCATGGCAAGGCPFGAAG